jgi:hypothetical protein
MHQFGRGWFELRQGKDLSVQIPTQAIFLKRRSISGQRYLPRDQVLRSDR